MRIDMDITRTNGINYPDTSNINQVQIINFDFEKLNDNDKILFMAVGGW